MAISIEELEAEIAKRQQAQQAQAVGGMSMADIDAEIARRQQTQPDEFRQALVDNPFMATLAEAGSAVTRGLTDVGEFFTTKPIRAVQQLAGVPAEERLPLIEQTEIGQDLTTGQFMEEGLARDVVRAGGELAAPGAVGGQMLRTAAKAIPVAQTTAQGVIKSLGGSTVGQDIVGGALSGAGGEIGEEFGGETGKLVGSFLAPASMATAPIFKKVLEEGAIDTVVPFIKGIVNPLSKMSDEGASILLNEAMIREGLSPDEVIMKLKSLGPEAIPADIGNNFARLLRTSANKVAQIEGRSADVFKSRHAGQGDRLLGAFDESTALPSLGLDDELIRLNLVMKPKINDLYAQAGAGSIQLSPKLKTLMTGKSSLGKATAKAQQSLENMRAAGDTVTNIDLINATKQTLDDQINVAIRKGANNKSRELVRLKNIMVEEADTAIPVYKQARDLFAGKASLENSAKQGESFLKLSKRDVVDLTKSMGESEKRIFKLGAKKAILDKFDDIRTNADLVGRVFSKNGDTEKLRHLFDDSAAFAKFNNALEQETQFVLTRRAAQANSTTAKQLFDDEDAFSTLTNVAGDIGSASGASRIFNKIMTGLGRKKTDDLYTKALEDAGDVLLIKGIEPNRIRKLLTQGSPKAIQSRITQAMKRPTIKAYQPAAVSGATVTAFEDQQ